MDECLRFVRYVAIQLLVVGAQVTITSAEPLDAEDLGLVKEALGNLKESVRVDRLALNGGCGARGVVTLAVLVREGASLE